MRGPVEYLDLEDLIHLATLLLGDPPPIRDLGLLESAVARPQTSVRGEDAYATLWEKAAALMQSLVNSHSLIDGNKRLGWLGTAVFLELNEIDVRRVSNDDVYDLVYSTAAGNVEVAELAAALERLATGELR